MKEKFVKSINHVVKDIFSTMISIDPVSGEYFKKNGKSIHSNISGIMGLSGTITASIIVHFEKSTALVATSNMLGVEYTEIDADVTDAVGEITNMIAGGVKVEFSKMGIELNVSLPTVVSGDDFKTRSTANSDTLVIPFSTGNGNFYVEFSFEEN